VPAKTFGRCIVMYTTPRARHDQRWRRIFCFASLTLTVRRTARSLKIFPPVALMQQRADGTGRGPNGGLPRHRPENVRGTHRHIRPEVVQNTPPPAPGERPHGTFVDQARYRTAKSIGSQVATLRLLEDQWCALSVPAGRSRISTTPPAKRAYDRNNTQFPPEER